MATCSRCYGEGVETYEEDYRQFRDTCYHCCGTGEVDEETDFNDRLSLVANSLAYIQESEYRRACDSDPDGDGYDLCAAENGYRTFDYFRVRVWERAADIGQDLVKMSREDQEFLVAWNEVI